MGLKPAAAAALIALVVASCGGAPSVASTTSSPPPPSTALKILHGGTVTVAVASLPTEFNPSTPSGSNAVTEMVMAQVWPQPFVVGAAMKPQTGPGLLSSAELVGVHPETVVYALKKSAHWSDGVPITAADFVYDWHEFLAVGASLPATFPLAGYEAIGSITGSHDGRRVTVVYKTRYADWPALFENLVPAHIASRYGWSAAFAGADPSHLVSGGPFVVSRVVPGRELVLSRNPTYWGRPAHLARIIFRVEHGERATLSALADGSVDVAQVVPGTAVDALVASHPDLVASDGLSPMLWQLDFNFADPVTSQLAVRQAIAKSLDRAELAATSAGLVSADDPRSGNRLWPVGWPGSQGNDGAYLSADAADADQLLEQAGYQFNVNGIAVDASGRPLVLTLTGPAGNSPAAAVEEEMQAQLLGAGVRLRIRNLPLGRLLSSVLPGGRYQIALAPYLSSPFPATTVELYTDPVGPTPDAAAATVPTIPLVRHRVAVYLAGDEQEPGATEARAVTRDVLGFDDPAVDSLYQRAISVLNAIDARAVYNEIDSDLWADMATLPLFQSPVALIGKADIANLSESETFAGPMWDAESWAIQVSPPSSSSLVHAADPGRGAVESLRRR